MLVHGATGRMGQALLRLCAEDSERFEVVGAVSRRPSQRVIDGVPQFAAAEIKGVPAFDVAIDFSLPEAFTPLLALCVARKSALVSGTTSIPVAWASNVSLGVAVLHELVGRAAQALPGWDCDILETHHARKQDAPSGTALTLGSAAQSGGAEPRYASLRAGDIVGEHTVQFTGMGERIELVHRAGNRDIFARGALHVASRLVGRPPGAYTVSGLL